ncbi:MULTISPECIES: hypothetical protein [Photorhabdus]|uniref:Uncharacterized protein n=2 Tax=Photorhabdus TaxID=29487 RepID=A0A022PRH2_9GAMM|nr:hypothetical protein BA1DRAFT_00439 [Photorhabdus aegyptia]
MPSDAAVQAYWKNLYPELKPKQLERLSKNVAAIIIPADVHRKLSATYDLSERVKEVTFLPTSEVRWW